jgi:hypothetical protein
MRCSEELVGRAFHGWGHGDIEEAGRRAQLALEDQVRSCWTPDDVQGLVDRVLHGFEQS